MAMLARLLSLSGQAAFIALVNAVIGLLVVFNVAFTQTQLASVDVCVNAVLGFLVLLLGQQVANSAQTRTAAR